jgi:hypothetical protein
MKFNTSDSFRSINKTIILLNIYLNLNLKTPSHVTILIWAKKVGIYRLNNQKEMADDWIVMIDESVEFGNDKLLLILGIRESHVDFSRPLNYQDMVCLKLIASISWTGEQINEVIQEITSEIGNIKYAVADMGNAIKKALRLALIPHVHDINHKLSWFIKELLKDDADFDAYTKKLAHLRGSMPLGKLSYILPPQQRVNSRFMNLKPIFDWGIAILKLIEDGKLNPMEEEKLAHIKEHDKLIRQLVELIRLANQTQEIIKNNGLSETTKNDCLALFDKIEDCRILQFKDMIDKYFIQTMETDRNTDKFLCSSDILESSFGKYKTYISKNKSVGITDLSLTIPAFLGKIENDEIKRALECVKVKHVKQWSKVNLGDSITMKRRRIFKMAGRKNQVTS